MLDSAVPIGSIDSFLRHAPRETCVCLRAQTKRKPLPLVLLVRLSRRMAADGAAPAACWGTAYTS